jgi:uncharacterized repeat protein (TIGR01451 family)
MKTSARLLSLRWILAGALPLVLLFVALSPAAAGDHLVAGSVSAAKTCSPRLVQPGSPVSCTITITNSGTAPRTVILTDIIGGGTPAPDTSMTSIFGPPSFNGQGRQVYGPMTYVLTPGVNTLLTTIIPFASKSKCHDPFYASLTNEIHVDDVGSSGMTLAPTSSGQHIATATTSFSVSCNAPGL